MNAISIRAQLDSQNWPKVIKELTIYAGYRFIFWKLITPKGIRGQSPEEVAIEAIECVYTGRYNWNPEKGKLIPFLKFGVIDSLVANLARAKEVVIGTQLDLNDLDVEDPQNINGELYAKQVLAIIKEHLKDEPLLMKVFDCLYEGEKRSEICNHLHISNEEYDNVVKRLRTRTMKLYNQGRLEIDRKKTKNL